MDRGSKEKAWRQTHEHIGTYMIEMTPYTQEMIIRWFGKVGSLYEEKLKLALIH